MSASGSKGINVTAAGMAGATFSAGKVSNQRNRVGYMGRSQNVRKKKKLNYNSREISGQLIRAKKARSASGVLASAKTKVGTLSRCLGTGQYDDAEVRVALAHARRMVKCAETKVRNLKEEEMLQHKYEREKMAKEQQKKGEIKRRVRQKEQDLRQKMATEELQQVHREKMKRQEILRKRRQHRDQEQNKISEADMKYLRDTINYMRDSGRVDTTAVSLDLTDAAIMMSELQMTEAQIEQQVELEVEAATADVGSVDAAMPMSGMPSGDAPVAAGMEVEV